MSKEQMYSRVQKKGQVTIPAELREKMGLREGDLVAFTETPDGILITAQELVALRALDRIGEALRAQGITLEEMIEAGRGVRGKIVREKYGEADDA